MWTPDNNGGRNNGVNGRFEGCRDSSDWTPRKTAIGELAENLEKTAKFKNTVQQAAGTKRKTDDGGDLNNPLAKKPLGRLNNLEKVTTHHTNSRHVAELCDRLLGRVPTSPAPHSPTGAQHKKSFDSN